MLNKRPFMLGLSTIKESAWKSTGALYDEVGHNTGNIAFHEGIRQIVSSRLQTVSWFDEPEKIDSCGDIGIIPAANQLGPHADFHNLSKKFERLNTRLVMIGLGAQGAIDGNIPEVPEGTLNWVRTIAERSPSDAPNISVRGNFTKKVLDHYGLGDHVIVCGCPSLFINPDPNLGKKIEKKLDGIQSIAVASGHQRWKHLSKIEAGLVKIAQETGGSYVGSSPLEMVMLTRGEGQLLSSAHLKDCRDYACPDMDIDKFLVWVRCAGNVFFDVWTWMEHYRRYDLVVGPRIHGVMLAIQAGVPGLCIAHDARTLELCQTMSVPYVTPKQIGVDFDLKRLSELARFSGQEFDEKRAALAKRYARFLSSNSIQASESLKQLYSHNLG